MLKALARGTRKFRPGGLLPTAAALPLEYPYPVPGTGSQFPSSGSVRTYSVGRPGPLTQPRHKMVPETSSSMAMQTLFGGQQVRYASEISGYYGFPNKAILDSKYTIERFENDDEIEKILKSDAVGYILNMYATGNIYKDEKSINNIHNYLNNIVNNIYTNEYSR